MISKYITRYLIGGLYYFKYTWSGYWRDDKFGHEVTDKTMIKKLDQMVALEKL